MRAYGPPPMLGREGPHTPLGRAFGGYGRIAQTEHLPRMADPADDTRRRRTIRRLTVRESRPRLARDVCHGGSGTVHQAYRDGMGGRRTDSARSVLDATALRTTHRADAAVARLRAEG